MKKFVSVLVIIMMLASYANVYAANSIDFPDMQGHWAADSVKVLSGKGIIAGWGGLFHPNETVWADAYIKMVVTALGYTQIENAKPYWATNYIDKAEELGLILPGEIETFTQPISRGMMARIAMRALKDEAVPEYIEAYKGMVLDYNSIDPDMQLDILKCIEKGILKGMPDSTFRPNTNCTRAEAATVIHRMIS